MTSARNRFVPIVFALCAIGPAGSRAEEVGARWGTEVREREFYPIVSLPIPKNLVVEAGAFCLLPDGRTLAPLRSMSCARWSSQECPSRPRSRASRCG